jgi:hypothetical protein
MLFSCSNSNEQKKEELLSCCSLHYLLPCSIFCILALTIHCNGVTDVIEGETMIGGEGEMMMMML